MVGKNLPKSPNSRRPNPMGPRRYNPNPVTPNFVGELRAPEQRLPLWGPSRFRSEKDFPKMPAKSPWETFSKRKEVPCQTKGAPQPVSVKPGMPKE